MALKIDYTSVLLGLGIAIAGLAIYDYYMWAGGGILAATPTPRW